MQHFLNAFFMIFIIRAACRSSPSRAAVLDEHFNPGLGLVPLPEARAGRPAVDAEAGLVSLPGWIGLPGLRHSIGLARWWHLGIDALWLLNGVVFYVLLFSTGQWRRIVPYDMAGVPQQCDSAHSVLVPALAGGDWVDRLQQPAAACLLRDCVCGPTAGADHGVGHVPGVVDSIKPVSRVLSIQVARSVHFLVLVWFLFFIVIHVTLVFTTGLVANLNHIYAGRNDSSWIGFTLFAVSMAIMIFVWVAATPFTLRRPRAVQRIGFALVGPVQRLFEHVDATPGEYAERDISPYFWHNGAFPTTESYRELYDEGFAGWRLKVHGFGPQPRGAELGRAARAAAP